MSCEFFANVGSFCSGDPSRSCTADDQCSGRRHVHDQLLRSAARRRRRAACPACVLLRFATDGIGAYNLSTGAASMSLTFNALAFLGVSVSQPCPICDCGEADSRQLPDRRCRRLRRVGRHRQPAVHRAGQRPRRSDVAAVSAELVAERVGRRPRAAGPAAHDRDRRRSRRASRATAAGHTERRLLLRRPAAAERRV